MVSHGHCWSGRLGGSKQSLKIHYPLMSASLQARFQQASIEFQKLQGDLSDAVGARQRLDAQLSENELVKKVPGIIDDIQQRLIVVRTGILAFNTREHGVQTCRACTSRTGPG